MDQTETPTSREELLAIDPETLQGRIPWNLLMRPLYHNRHATVIADVLWRRAHGIDVDGGILAGDPHASQAWATACMVSRDGSVEAERFMLRAVQIALTTGCCAWHATAQAANALDRCQCHDCATEDQETTP